MAPTTLDTDRPEATGCRVVSPLWRLVVSKANPITPLNSQGCPISFYCVHPIAGDVTSFQELADHLDNVVSFYGIQVLREKMNAEFGRSITMMADFYVSELVAHQPKGPIFVGGWSAGAIVALEMAQQLRKSGRAVALLVALDGAPCNTGVAISLWNPVFLIKILRNIPFYIGDELRQAESWVELISNFRAKLAFRLRRAIPAVRNDQTLHGDAVETLLTSRRWPEAQMAFIRTLYEAMRQYRPSPYDAPVLVIESRTQPLFNLRQVGAAWKRLNPSAEIVQLESNHMGIFREPLLTQLAGHLRARLCTVPVADASATPSDFDVA